MIRIKNFLQLMRPANLVTAVADIIAGVSLAGFFAQWLLDDHHISPLIMLCLSTIGLYGGGVVFNDVFDLEIDKVERPERPIPKGIVSLKEASILGTILLLAGILSAFGVSIQSGFFAILIAIAALVYDKWGKHHSYLGPINMGLCRGLNLLLGISIVPDAIYSYWYFAIVPIIYISAITMISRGEVHGSNKAPLYGAAFLYIFVISLILCFAILKNTWLLSMFFIGSFSLMIFKPLITAIKNPSGPNIGKSVKAGVIGLILMNAAWAAASGSIEVAVVLALLLPLSILLARIFAVT